MDEAPETVCKAVSLLLRLGQTFFASSSLLVISGGFEFYKYTALCYLVTVLGLMIPWSTTLAVLNIFSIFSRFPFRQSGVFVMIVLGDWALSMLLLAASCSAAGVVDLLMHLDGEFCSHKVCGRYQLSTALALCSWVLTALSSLSNLWLVASR